MQFANLQWHDQQPYSLDFNDVYYSSDNGIGETEYVFIQHNQLIERFANLSVPEFTIIETGFGTGLNFFCTLQHWLTHAPLNATLRFVTIERYPLTQQDFNRANQYWPTLTDYVKQLSSHYTQLAEGKNQLACGNSKIQLELWVGDANTVLPQINMQADAWFLDGFAPSKNSDMWSEELFKQVARLSKPITTFATFTSASQVRRTLQKVGFDVKKTSGFGKKREMLYGTFLNDLPCISVTNQQVSKCILLPTTCFSQ